MAALLILCYLATIGLLVLALVGISSPARWSRPSYYLTLFILFAVFLETVLLGGLAVPLS